MTLKRLAWGVAALLIVAAGLLVLGARMIDAPAVRAEIQQRLAAALGGQIAWESLEVRLLPPRGELRSVRLDIPGAVSARAEQVDARVRLWPLLLGRVEIASLSVSQPEIRVTAAGGARQEGGARIDPLAAYREGLEPVVRTLRRFAPDTAFRIEGAALDLNAGAFQLRDLNLDAHSGSEALKVELDAASNHWQRLRAEASIAYADLAGRGRVEIEGLALGHDLPAASLRAQLRTDAKTAIECDLEARLGSLLSEAKAHLTLPAGDKPPRLRAQLSGVELAQALGIARRWVPALKEIESAAGRVSANAVLELGEPWHAAIEVVRSDASLKLARLPWKLSAHAAHVTLSQQAVGIKGLRGALGDSAFSEVAAHLHFGEPLRLAAASGRATLRLEQWFPWLQKQQLPLEGIAALSGSVDVTLHRLALRVDRPAEADFDALVAPAQVSATLKPLPGPVSLAGGSVRVTPQRVQLEKLAVAMLDAKAVVSGSVAMQGPVIEIAAAEGALGEKMAQWAMQLAQAPAGFEPKTPLRFSAQRVAWGPGRALDVEARIDFDGGPQVGLVLGWQPDQLELRRLAIKDAQSDATLGARVGDKLLQASFSGTLYGRSVAAMLRRPPEESGSARGELRVTVDRAQPQRTVGEGHLKLEALDLSWLTGRKARIERVELSAEPAGLRIAAAELDWEEQKFSLSGAIQRTAQGPVIDARLESPGVVVERLLPAEKPAAAGAPKQSKLWPLPVTGSVQVRAGFVQYGRHRIAPLEGTLALERERARLEVKEARMCGLSFPLAAEGAAGKLEVSALITMKDEPLEAAMLCLTGGGVEISGNADLRAELRTHGLKEQELIRNLTGSAQAELRKGRVKKFALIGNILSLRNIASPKKMQEEGFPYRSMTARGQFENGEFVLAEGFFDSDAVSLAANGTVDLLGANSRLNVLVGLLTTVDRVAGAIPIIGDVFGGSMLALPVGVSGDIRDPLVVPLGPRAVTDRLLGIFERTLKLPGKLIVAPAAKEPPP